MNKYEALLKLVPILIKQWNISLTFLKAVEWHDIVANGLISVISVFIVHTKSYKSQFHCLLPCREEVDNKKYITENDAIWLLPLA